MVSISICDDNPKHIQYIHDLLSKLMKEPFTAQLFSDEKEFINAVRSGEKFDIVILDIILNNANGVELAKEINRCNPQASIIFVSGSLDYVQDIYETKHIYFLKKPIETEKLALALQKALTRAKNSFIMLNLKASIRKLFFDEIIYLENMNKITVIYLDNETLEYPKKLKELEDMLPKEQFIRCHKSFIINLEKAAEINKQYITMSNKVLVPISKRHQKEVRESIAKNFIKDEYI